MAHTASDLTWLLNFLSRNRLPTPFPIPLFCDNQAAPQIASNLMFHEHTKYIKVDCHFFRDKILSRDIATPFVKSKNQLVDIFTKSLCRNRLESICSKLDLYDTYMLQLSQPVVHTSCHSPPQSL